MHLFDLCREILNLSLDKADDVTGDVSISKNDEIF